MHQPMLFALPAVDETADPFAGASLQDQLAHADDLIDRLVIEGEEKDRIIANQDRIISELRYRVAS